MKHTLVGPVKKLNCLNNVLCSFVLVKSYREKKMFKPETNNLIYITTLVVFFYILAGSLKYHLMNLYLQNLIKLLILQKTLF